MLFLEWKFWILIHISFKFIPKGPIFDKLALLQVMNVMELNKGHVIIWTNADLNVWSQMMSLSCNELNPVCEKGLKNRPFAQIP